MNKRLLLLCSTMLMSVMSFAQWEQPTIAKYFPSSTYAEMAVSTAAKDGVAGDTTVYYLLNIEAPGFLTGGTAASHSQWSTNAVVKETGNKVIVMKYYANDSTEWDGKTYEIKDWYKTKYYNVFPTSNYAMFIDRASQANYMWEIEPQGGNVYYISVADVNPEYNDAALGYNDSHLGFNDMDEDYAADETGATKPLTPMLDPSVEVDYDVSETSIHIKWAFIPEAIYNDYLAAIEVYNAAVALGEYIESVKTDYPNVDVSAAEAVYNNTSSTTEELTVAKTELSEVVREFEVLAVLDGASEDHPKDATSLLTNPDFSEGSTNGWTCTFVKGTSATNIGYQSDTYTNGDVTISGFIEAWAAAGTLFNSHRDYRAIGDAELSQTINGLPAGKYVLTGDFIAVNQDGNSSPVEGVQLFATGGGIDMYTTISTGNGAPERFELTFISGGGDITMGLRTSNTSANWIGGDNFTLVYYGEVSEDPYKVVLDAAVASAEAKYPSLDDVVANADVKAEYSRVLDAAKNATDEYQAMNDSLTAAIKALDNSVSEYTTLAGYMEENQAKQEVFNETKFSGVSELLGDLYMEWEEAYNDGTATSEYIAAAEKQMSDVIINYITSTAEEGDELTALITNPDFDTRFSGWSTTGATPAWGGIGENTQGSLAGVTLTSGNAEVYQAVFDMYQVIPNMPKGSYKLTCQAFERNDGIGSYTGSANAAADYLNYGDTNLRAILYANDSQTKVCHIYKYATTEQVFSDGGWFSDVNAGTDEEPAYIPNGMTGANYHFYQNERQDYVVELYFTVAQDGDSVRIGIKNDAKTGWVIFDNFRLFYQGAGADAYKAQIDELTASLNSVFDDAEYYGSDAQDKATAAINAMADAYASGSGDACMTATAQAQEALTYAKTSITDYQNLSEVYGTLSEALETYQEVASEDIIAKGMDIIDAIEPGIDNKSLTNAEAEDLYKQANLMVSAIQTSAKLNDAGIDTSVATEENPVDVSAVITNATFDTVGDFTGWSGSSFGAGGTTSTCAERYAMDFDTYQDLGGLPAGYYILKADGYYRRGDAANDYKIELANPDSARFVQLYATSSVDAASAPVVSTSSAVLSADQVTEIGTTTGNCSDVGAEDATLYVPNYMISANAWFEAGYYDNSTTAVEVGEDGVLRIGVKTIGRKGFTTDWAIFDNFELYYLGTAAPTAIEDINEAEEVAVKGIYNLAGQKLSAPQKGINIINGKKVLVK